MDYYSAPMEGVTTYLFRSAHHRYFGGVDRYYMPFVSPSQDHLFTPREMRELSPDHNQGVPAVPQLLTRRWEDFVWAAGALADMGYREVNLNLGCPSGTVTAKRKGAGMLGDTQLLTDFLDHIFSAGLPIDISVKTRLGLEDESEFEEILDIYNRYPISQLTIHPRVRKDMYRKPVRPEAFAAALPRCRHSVCYNGDLIDTKACLATAHRFPQVEALMVGRGLIANPALARMAKGGAPADREALEAFLGDIFEGYTRDFGSPRSAMMRMKELWFYLIHLFEDSAAYGKKLKKAQDPQQYRAVEAAILRDLPLRAEADPGFLST